MTHRTLIVGGGHAGRVLAEMLATRLDGVTYVDEDSRAVSLAGRIGLSAREVALTDPRALADVGPDAETAIAAADDDGVNLLLAQLLRTRYDVDRVVLRMNDPRNRDAFADLDVEAVCASSVFAAAFARTVTEGDVDPAMPPPPDDADEWYLSSEPFGSAVRGGDGSGADDGQRRST